MSAKVWLTIPSARPVAELEPVLEAWRDMGYGIALLRQGDEPSAGLTDLLIPTEKYKGWAPSVNHLALWLIAHVTDCQWCVGGGDDTFPDPKKRAQLIAQECEEHFANLTRWPQAWQAWRSTFGVMQPSGDDWKDVQGRIIERFAGSPWMGRAWCERAYEGKGPIWPYPHNWADEELQNVAIKHGVFWQRPDLTQTHAHWLRDGKPNRAQPAYWQSISVDYAVSKPIFTQRKAAGWPGSDVLL